MSNKLDKKATRGAIVKSLAIGSSQMQYIEPFKHLLSYCLDQIFQNEAIHGANQEAKLEGAKKIIGDVFEAANL